MTRYIEPRGKSTRVDSGVVEGSEISMFYDPMISKLTTHSKNRKETISEMVNALDKYFIEGVKTNKDFLSNILQNPEFFEGNYSTAFISENYPNGYNPYLTNFVDKTQLYAVVTFVNYKYLLRAASISNQLKGFNKTVDNSWCVIDQDKMSHVSISFNNFNKSYDIYVDKKYINLKSNWNIGYPLFSAIIDNHLLYFSIKRNGPRFIINHKGALNEIVVLSKRHAELNKIMIPRLQEDNSKFLMAPMPGLLVSILVKENQEVEENQPLAIIEAMKMENIINSEKKTKIKKINCK